MDGKAGEGGTRTPVGTGEGISEQPRCRLYLVRHGETEWNRQGRMQGHTDTELNENGLRQARRFSVAMRRCPCSAVVSSDLKRARTTAETFLASRSDKAGIGGAVRLDPRLREFNYGQLSGLLKTDPKVVAYHRKARSERRQGNMAFRQYGCESTADLVRRGRAALVDAAALGTDVFVFAHGGIIRAIVTDALARQQRKMPLKHASNCCLTILECFGPDKAPGAGSAVSLAKLDDKKGAEAGSSVSDCESIRFNVVSAFENVIGDGKVDAKPVAWVDAKRQPKVKTCLSPSSG